MWAYRGEIRSFGDVAKRADLPVYGHLYTCTAQNPISRTSKTINPWDLCYKGAEPTGVYPAPVVSINENVLKENQIMKDQDVLKENQIMKDQDVLKKNQIMKDQHPDLEKI